MAFIKTTLDPINTRAADATFDFEEPYIQTGIISGQSYTSAQVQGGIPKPSYLQIAANSAVVTVVGSQTEPLRLVFPLGLHDANTGGEVGAWRSFTGKSTANSTVTVSVNEKAWVYAEINENGEPNNTNAWTIDYGHEIGVGKTYTSSTTEPTSPIDGDVWFDVTNNKLFKYNNSLAQWEWKKRVYLGEAGVGNNGYIYTIQSWFPNREYANYQDTFYPVYYENPWRLFDGVSFLTNGLYTAAEAANWANNFTIAQSVAGNQIAMNAVANSAAAMATVSISANTFNAIANSNVALTVLEANTSATGFLANSSNAMISIANNLNAMNFIANSTGFMISVANSSVAMPIVANSSVAMIQIANSSIAMTRIANSTIAMAPIANSTIAQGAILTGSQITTFRNTIANNSSILSVLKNGSAGNILFDLISTNSSYQTLVANSQGQLVALANSTKGPILALGGSSVTEITDGGVDYRVHTFTGLGTLNVRSVGEQSNVQYLVAAGGAGGGGTQNNWVGSGGGGAGGVLRTLSANYPLSQSTSYTVTVGGGGAGSAYSGSPGVTPPGANGSNSVFGSGPSAITCIGGGGGGASSKGNGHTGGSGGGGINNVSGSPGTPGQGNAGGTGGSATGAWGGGGGGGAGGAGATGNPISTGDGGIGISSPITGTPAFYGGGGAGGISSPGAGGSGVGGSYSPSEVNGGNAVAFTGSGGSGVAYGGSPGNVGGNGSSGIVIIRYPIEKV